MKVRRFTIGPLLYTDVGWRSHVGRPPFPLGEHYYRHLGWRFYWRTDLAGYRAAQHKAHTPRRADEGGKG